MPSATVSLVKDMQFLAETGSGHVVIMDANEQFGGHDTGSRPMELLLVGFGGCTGMDVISILRKKRQHVKGLSIKADGTKADGHPGRYTKIHLKYTVTGREVKPDAVERAITLSLEKYCSAAATLGASAEITHEYEILEAD